MSCYPCVCQKSDPFKILDQRVQKLVEQKPKAAGNTFGAAIAHLLTVYKAIQPVLAAFAALGIIPANWRNALTTLMKALDAVVTLGGSVDADFKAGKDL